MTVQSGLILAAEPIPRIRLRPAVPAGAHVVFVYLDRTGQVLKPNGRPGSLDRRLFPSARMRYEVDTGDRRQLIELRSSPLPAKGDAHFFHGTVDVGFRVTDATAVVRRNVKDAETLVGNHLAGAFRRLTRQFDIKESAEAEAELNRSFRGPLVLEEGITIYHCQVRLMTDPAARAYLSSVAEAMRKKHVTEVEHVVAKLAAEHENHLKEIAHDGELTRRKTALEAMMGQPTDPYLTLLMHLAEHPDDTQGVFELLLRVWEKSVDREDARDDRSMEMLRDLLNRGILQSADVERFREEMTGRVRDAASIDPTVIPLLPGWDGAQVLPPIKLGRMADHPRVQDGRATAADDDGPATVRLVYLLVEESAGVAPHLGRLYKALREFRRTVALDRRRFGELRLTVLGFSETVVERAADDASGANGRHEPVGSGGGVRYGPAFEEVANRIERYREDGAAAVDPWVYLLGGTQPGDELDWAEQHRRLVALAPHIVACGLATASAPTLVRISTHPHLAFMPEATVDDATAITGFITFVTANVLGLNSGVTGAPSGFRGAGPREEGAPADD